jgi:hypothetical protein
MKYFARLFFIVAAFVCTAAQADTQTEFRKNLKPGTRIMACSTEKVLLVGTVIEVKKPMANVQWENRDITNHTSWAPINQLYLADRDPSNKHISSRQIEQEALRRTGGNAFEVLRRATDDPDFQANIYADLLADDECR